jgi:hypothetical protein
MESFDVRTIVMPFHAKWVHTVGFSPLSSQKKENYTNFTPTSRILLNRAMLRRRGVTLSTMDAAASGPPS